MGNCVNKASLNDKYTMSYTACSLVCAETKKVAELYLEERDWKKVAKIAFDTNLLQYRTQNALKRTLSEIISRLKKLPEEGQKRTIQAESGIEILQQFVDKTIVIENQTLCKSIPEDTTTKAAFNYVNQKIAEMFYLEIFKIEHI